MVTLSGQSAAASEALRDLTGGRGPDAYIDAVEMEAHGTSIDALYDWAKMAMFLATDRLHALRQAIHARVLDKVPMEAAFAKGLALKMGQTHVHNIYVHCSRTLNRARLILPL
jgi:hypothetical protein